MIPELVAARAGEAWAVNRVMLGLHDTRDVEGRPLNERRAPASARKGVVSDLRPCPYHDERAGILMNVSALSQVGRHLEPVMERAGGFRAALGEGAGWDPAIMTVLDLLFAPALALIDAPGVPDVSGPVSVGYKVGAGFFGAINALLVSPEVRDMPVDEEAFLAFVKRHGLLIGQREACAGPPGMIATLTRILFRGLHGRPRPDERRVAIARGLTAQARLAAAWSLFDEEAERELFREWHSRGRLRPRNAFMAQKLAQRAEALRERAAVTRERVLAALPAAQGGLAVGRLEEALVRRAPPGGDVVAVERVAALMAHGDSAVDLADPAERGALALDCVRYLAGYRVLAEAFDAVERQLRAELRFAEPAPLRLHGGMFAPARTMDWFAAILGHRLESTPEAGAVVLRSHHRRVEILTAT